MLRGGRELLKMLIRVVPTEEQRAGLEFDPDICPGTACVTAVAGGQLYCFY